MSIYRGVNVRLACESGSSRFQLGEGPGRGLLRDYEPSDGTFSSTSYCAGLSIIGPGPSWRHRYGQA